MTIWLLIVAAIFYIAGFLLGRKYEKDYIFEDVYATLVQVNKASEITEILTLFYTKEAYDQTIEKLNEEGRDYEQL